MNLPRISLFLNVDIHHHPYRVRSCILPPEVTLRRFFRNTSYSSLSWKDEIPASKWEGIQCGETGYVISIDQFQKGISGSLSWNHLPFRVQDLVLAVNRLQGEISLASLPLTCKKIRLDFNEFCGSLSLSELRYHGALSSLILTRNNFGGSLDLTCLPHGLKHLCLDHNHFSGSISFNHLPGSLSVLLIHKNDLEGVLDLEKLPHNVKLVKYHVNAFDLVKRNQADPST